MKNVLPLCFELEIQKPEVGGPKPSAKCQYNGDMMMKNPLLCLTAAVSLVALTSVVQARSA
jgi:hypothetical protein